MNTRSFVIAAILLASFSGTAQDAYFSNTSQSLLRLNPSFAGSNGGVRNQLSYRYNNDRGFSTIYNAADVFAKKINGGIGLSYLNDLNVGLGLVQQELSLSYAQHLNFGDGDLKVIPSLEFSYLKRSLDLQAISFEDVINDPIYTQTVHGGYSEFPYSDGNRYARKNNFNLSSGLLVAYKHLYAGFSVHNINQPDMGLLGAYALPARLNFHASYNFSFSERSQLNISGRLVKQGPRSSAQVLATAILYKHLSFGLGYASAPPQAPGNSLMITAGIRTHYVNIMVGYAGDMSNDGAKRVYGAWETSVAFTLRNKENRKLLTDLETW